MIEITPTIHIEESEIEMTAVCSQGSGGQNVNKVSTAIHLRFDITASSLPEWLKVRLLSAGDKRITKEGVLVIKAQTERSQERNRERAVERLIEFIAEKTVTQKPRRPTRPSRGAVQRRLDQKAHRSSIKKGRGRVDV